MTASRRILPLLALLALCGAPPAGEPVSAATSRTAVAPRPLGVMQASPGPVAIPAVPQNAVPTVRDPYVAGQLLVAPPPDLSLEALADQVDGTVVRSVGRSGFGVLRVDDPRAASVRLAELGAAPSPLARVVGTGRRSGSRTSKKTATTTDASTTDAPTTDAALVLPTSWHLDGAVPATSVDVSDWVVAILDTGVAYEDYGAFRRAPGLAGINFVAPADFVEIDGHPNDDHQHGTHIASIIASEGALPGVAPGVSLMPIKVLDRANMGTEWALIEGIHHAVDQGANVINLSLSFPLGYVPSPALGQALGRAHEAGVVLVAAAGNDNATELSWPAASRLVVSVGASVSDAATQWYQHTDYTNRSPALDILAPGGSMDRDANGDGFPDGILAETVDPADPGRLGYWFYQGTSQAAAVASGSVVHLLDAGIAADDIAATLQQGQGGYSAWDAALTGTGSDYLDLPTALTRARSSEPVYVGLLPFVAEGMFGPQPLARVVALDGDGQPVSGADIVASVYAAERVSWTMCTTDSTGSCELASWDYRSADAWAFRVDAVVIDAVAQRPSRLLFATDGGELLLQAIEDANPASYSDDYTLAVHWDGGFDTVLQHTLVESWAVVDAGTGLLSSPLGVVFLPQHVAGVSKPDTLALDLDGTGLLSSPLGLQVSLRTLYVDGSGLLSSPLGFSTLRLVGIEGSGLLSSPLGFHATQLYALSGSGLLSSPLGLGFRGEPILMDTGMAVGASLAGTAYGSAMVPGGGLTTFAGYEPASWLVACGLVDVGLALAPATAAPLKADDAVELVR